MTNQILTNRLTLSRTNNNNQSRITPTTTTRTLSQNQYRSRPNHASQVGFKRWPRKSARKNKIDKTRSFRNSLMVLMKKTNLCSKSLKCFLAKANYMKMEWTTSHPLNFSKTTRVEMSTKSKKLKTDCCTVKAEFISINMFSLRKKKQISCLRILTFFRSIILNLRALLEMKPKPICSNSWGKSNKRSTRRNRWRMVALVRTGRVLSLKRNLIPGVSIKLLRQRKLISGSKFYHWKNRIKLTIGKTGCERQAENKATTRAVAVQTETSLWIKKILSKLNFDLI